MIGHSNVNSVRSALNEAARTASVPVTRVAPNCYQFGRGAIQPEPPATPTERRTEVGTMFEVVALHRGRIILVDSDDEFWLGSLRMLHQ